MNGPLKIAQVEAYKDPAKRFYIAKKLVEAKAQRTLEVIKWLAARYGAIPPRVQSDLSEELERLDQCVDLPRLTSIEGRIAEIYWRYLQQVLPSKFGFRSRMHETHQMNASDPFNVLLNYGYSILESQCRKALNSVGLEPTVGFLHESRQTKHPLVYDFHEPYRWLVDTTVISCLESARFGKRDFYRMDNYVLRLRPEAVRKLIDALRIKFNSPVAYKRKFYSWGTLIRLKAQELANYVLSRENCLDFEKPAPALERQDSEATRILISLMTTAEARKLGIGRGALHYLRKNASKQASFRMCQRTLRRLESVNRSPSTEGQTSTNRGFQKVLQVVETFEELSKGR